MATVNFAVRCVDYLFPDFEFGWLAKEMNESLPLEMDFRTSSHSPPSCLVRWTDDVPCRFLQA